MMASQDCLLRIDKESAESAKSSNPESLRDLCFNLICQNLDTISEVDSSGHRTLKKGIVFPSEICEKIIEHAQRTKAANFNDSFFSIFKNAFTTKLKRIKIVDSSLTDQSIETLTSHQLTQLELVDCPKITEKSIEYINAKSENLQIMAFRGDTPILPNTAPFDIYYKRGYIFKALKLKRLALEHLDLQRPSHEYLNLLAGMPKLTHLDLSSCSSIDSFHFYSLLPNLTALNLYNVRINHIAVEFVENICHLKKLIHLDISQSNIKNGKFENPNIILDELVRGLPKLISLDISGTNLAGRGVAEKLTANDTELCDIPGLASRVKNPLNFLGLYGTVHGACKRHDIPARVISGDANEDQMLIAAHVCMNNKQELLQKILSDLYHIFRYQTCNKMDQALPIVLEAMEKHPKQKHIQVSGSATLFYIIKTKDENKFVASMKRRIIGTLLNGMTAFKDEESMMRNGCLALCQFHIPRDVMWNYEAVVKILLHSVKYSEPEGFVQRIGIYLLNSMACQVEGKEKRLLGDLGCVTTMLDLVTYRLESGIFDDVLEVAWSTMWNITDETPINCERFLAEKGMDLFLQCVQQYPRKEELMRNMMGLLGNVAEVDYLRKHLMEDRYIAVFASLLNSKSDGIEVSYNAAGILAHIASDGAKAWTVESQDRDEILVRMVIAIKRWDLFSQRNINYRSFLPLLRLLDVYHTPACRYWAAWALANLTNVYPTKYCELVEKEGGLEKLQNLLCHPGPIPSVKELAQMVIKNCYQYKYKEFSNIEGSNRNCRCKLQIYVLFCNFR
ncbi:protein zer-1 homolog [Prorops nasuta]|uniref:protein zer-1 homolog n=1 Tax=Prorops nasuta TaxID=863751 RepID=UPI0034CEDED3